MVTERLLAYRHHINKEEAHGIRRFVVERRKRVHLDLRALDDGGWRDQADRQACARAVLYRLQPQEQSHRRLHCGSVSEGAATHGWVLPNRARGEVLQPALEVRRCVPPARRAGVSSLF